MVVYISKLCLNYGQIKNYPFIINSCLIDLSKNYIMWKLRKLIKMTHINTLNSCKLIRKAKKYYSRKWNISVCDNHVN